MLQKIALILLAIGGLTDARRGVWLPLPIPIPQPAAGAGVAATTPAAASSAGSSSSSAATPTCLMGMGCYNTDATMTGCTGTGAAAVCPSTATPLVLCRWPTAAMQGATVCTGTDPPDCSCAPMTPFTA